MPEKSFCTIQEGKKQFFLLFSIEPFLMHVSSGNQAGGILFLCLM